MCGLFKKQLFYTVTTLIFDHKMICSLQPHTVCKWKCAREKWNAAFEVLKSRLKVTDHLPHHSSKKIFLIHRLALETPL